MQRLGLFRSCLLGLAAISLAMASLSEAQFREGPTGSAPPNQIIPIIPAPPLNEHCVVSVLNRTAQVRPDGKWTIPNVPTNFGQVRARATCVADGLTHGGQSDLFTVPTNGIVNVGEIFFDVLELTPSSLRVTTPTATLTSAGATTRLTVTAVFPNGSTRNVTSDPATSYRSSSPAIATVSSTGVVTAVASGPVLITVLYEAVSSFFRVTVSLDAGDSDRDGIPNDIELANGLDPNNPVDGFEDADGDGLTNKQELVDFGTDFQVADTDGDTIADGEEALPGADGFVTNPLLRDTDGDGSEDAAEIAAGSSPTDPTSSPALMAVEVSPANFVLTVNTILGEASQKLTVTGRRVDGSTANITADPGTNYTSNDLTVCNFGVEKGRVFASNNGNCTITATNSGFSGQATILVRTFAPTALAAVSIPGFANNVDVSGDYAYVAAGATGLQVVDVSDPNTPTVVSSKDTPGNANDVVVVGDLAYVADGASGLQILDISDPLNPTILKAVDTPGVAQDVAVKDTLALVADGATGLQVIDITDPATAKLIGSLDTPGTAKGVAVSREAALAVVAAGSSGIRVVDLTDPTSPVNLGSVSTSDARDVVLSGNFAFVAAFFGSLTVVDLSTPTAPVVRTSTTGGVLNDVAQAGRFAFGADTFFVNGVPIFDVGTPATPILRAILDFSGIDDANGTGLAVDGTFVYLTAENGTITENGATGNTRLYIGQYLSLVDTAGIPPTASITSPAPGATVIEEATLPISVQAADDVTVAAVSLLVNGVLVATDTAFPYQFTVTVPIGVSSLTLGATVVDVGGSVGAAPNVVVNVIPDPLTTVAGRVLMPDGTPAVGATVTCAEMTGATGAGGTFSIPNVPTIVGRIRCVATFTTPQGQMLQGGSPRAAPPVLGGVTNVGDIPVVPGAGEYPGQVFPVLDPVVVVMADLNGDQILDLVTATNTNLLGEVAVLLGNGNGTFQPQQRFGVGQIPRGVAVADLTGDGIVDLVVANSNSTFISLLRGNGNGTFQTQQTLFLSTSPRAVAVGDVNGDGTRDIVTANSADNVSVLLGNGNGTFQIPISLTMGAVPQTVSVADFNGDTRADFVTANFNSANVTVRLGNGNGTFQNVLSFAVGSQPNAAAIGDVNDDDITDIVTSNNIGTVSVLVGNGNGTFQTQRVFTVGSTPRGVTVGDVNGDDFGDVVATSSNNTVSLLLSNEDGTLQTQSVFAVGATPFAVIVADLNGDDRGDIISVNSAGTVSVLLGNGDGTFQAEQRFTVDVSANSIVAIDLNGDNALDLVTANGSGHNSVSVLFGNGNGTFQAERRFAVGTSPRGVAVADLNGDGKPDVIAANEGSANVSVLLHQ